MVPYLACISMYLNTGIVAFERTINQLKTYVYAIAYTSMQLNTSQDNLTTNQAVAGSNPAGCAIYFNELDDF